MRIKWLKRTDNRTDTAYLKIKKKMLKVKRQNIKGEKRNDYSDCPQFYLYAANVPFLKRK